MGRLDYSSLRRVCDVTVRVPLSQTFGHPHFKLTLLVSDVILVAASEMRMIDRFNQTEWKVTLVSITG